MAAMERNSDIINMQCYAPLFVNVNPGARQWRPNIIGYDALSAYGSPAITPSKCSAETWAKRISSATLNGVQMPVPVTQDSKSGTIFVKLVNRQNTPQTLRLDLNGARSVASSGTATILAADPLATNSMDELTEVIPVTRPITGVGPTFTQILEPNSITVLQLKAAVAPLGSRPASNVNPQTRPMSCPLRTPPLPRQPLRRPRHKTLATSRRLKKRSKANFSSAPCWADRLARQGGGARNCHKTLQRLYHRK